MSFRTGDHRIYVNVGLELSEESLRHYFGRYGRVVDVYLPRSKQTSAVLGYGFVTFDTREEVDRVLAVPTHLVEGQQIGVNKAGPRPKYEDQEGSAPGAPHGTGPRLYVGGVPRQLSEEDLKEHFGAWGQVTDVYFPPQKSRRRSSYCFVRFSTYQGARRAYTESQRRVKGMDVEAINMAKDRAPNLKGGDLVELAKSAGPAGLAGLVRNRDSQSNRNGGVLPVGAAQMSVVDLSSRIVPVNSLNPNISGSVGGLCPLLMNGGVQQTVLPVVEVEHSRAVMHGVNEQQSVPIPNVGLQPRLVPEPALSMAHVVGLNTKAQSQNVATVSPSVDVGMLQFHCGNASSMVVPVASVPYGGAAATFTKGGSHPSLNMIPESPINSLQTPVERISRYSVRPNNFACTTNSSVRSSVDTQDWAQAPYKSIGESHQWIYRANAPSHPIGGHGPQRSHNMHRQNSGFIPY